MVSYSKAAMERAMKIQEVFLRARMYHATNDTEIRDKASYMLSEFVKTVIR